MFQPFPFNSVGGRPRAAGSFAVSLKNQIKKEITTKEEVEDEHLLAGFLRKPSSDTFISPSSKKNKGGSTRKTATSPFAAGLIYKAELVVL